MDENNEVSLINSVRVELERRIPDLKISEMGGYCPYQAMGTLGKYNFYFRSRHCIASLSLSENDPIDKSSVQWNSTKILPAEDEFTDVEDFSKLMLEFVQSLEKEPFPYEFKGRKVDILTSSNNEMELSQTDEEQIFVGWGFSPEEAYANIFKISSYLEEMGISEDIQRRIQKLQDIQPEPLNEDERVFSEENPPCFEIVD